MAHPAIGRGGAARLRQDRQGRCTLRSQARHPRAGRRSPAPSSARSATGSNAWWWWATAAFCPTPSSATAATANSGINIVNWLAGDDNLITIHRAGPGRQQRRHRPDRALSHCLQFPGRAAAGIHHHRRGDLVAQAQAQGMSRSGVAERGAARRRRRARRIHSFQAGKGRAGRASPVRAEACRIPVHPHRARRRAAHPARAETGRLDHHRAVHRPRR